ncbi:hypothetical protein OS493_027625 [Desmophyllum pertusum]|uniref:Uncharacterized protein n=1 Tax=Desmophyllum pertusum TaxID=174260 RepID=A0A9W9ZM59_9CNID|nr:hypothetical protein OS493_027625 [Desmophyllum pertusum]
MGNCSTACFSQKQNVSAKVWKRKASRLANADLNKGAAGTRKSVERSQRSPTRISSILNRRQNRVSPCDNGRASDSGSIKTLQGSRNLSNPASERLYSTGWSASSMVTASTASYYELRVHSSDSYPPGSDHERPRTPTPLFQPGVTMGRLIIVQPCKSFTSSYAADSSTESLSPLRTPTYPETEAVDSLDTCSSTSSVGTWTGDIQDMEFEQMSEDESCQVFPAELDTCSSTSSVGTWTGDIQVMELDEMSEDESCQVFPEF